MWWFSLFFSLIALVSAPFGALGEQWKLGQWVGIEQLGGIPVVQTRIDVYPDCPALHCAVYWQYEVLFTTGDVFGVQAGRLLHGDEVTQGIQIYRSDPLSPNRGPRRGGLEPGMRVVMIPSADQNGVLQFQVEWGDRSFTRHSSFAFTDAVLVRLTLVWRNAEAGEFPVPFVGTAVMGDVLEDRGWPGPRRSRNTRAPHVLPLETWFGTRRVVWHTDDHFCTPAPHDPLPGQSDLDNDPECCTLEQALLDAPQCPGGELCCLNPLPYEPLDTTETLGEPAG